MAADSVAQIGTEIELSRHLWTRVLRVRDREAPGSNPGPPDQISNSKHPVDGAWRTGTAAVAPDDDSVAPLKQP